MGHHAKVDFITKNPSLAHFFWSIGFDVWENEDKELYGPSPKLDEFGEGMEEDVVHHKQETRDGNSDQGT